MEPKENLIRGGNGDQFNSSSGGGSTRYTQPFSYNLESAGEEGTLLQKNCGHDGMSKKKRQIKINDKAYAASYKKGELDGNIRRSERIKDKGMATESDCC